jgi:hypothetical protein
MYYTYAYLREDGTPYYIGKGKGNRAYVKCNRITHLPKDNSRILILKQNLTEEEAFRHEIYMIVVFGRKDLGSGILYNRTDGGEGCSGAIKSEEARRKIGKAQEGEKNHNYGKSASVETRRKMSNSRTGTSRSEETKRKMSEAQIGEKNHNYGKTRSVEYKRKLSKSNEKYHYTIYSTVDDRTYKTNNLNTFCKEHSLDNGNLQRTIIKNNLHKGFKMIKKEALGQFEGCPPFHPQAAR